MKTAYRKVMVVDRPALLYAYKCVTALSFAKESCDTGIIEFLTDWTNQNHSVDVVGIVNITVIHQDLGL